MAEMSTRPYRVETFLGADGWRWRVRHRNNHILVSSEAYADAKGARRIAGNFSRASGFPHKEITPTEQELAAYKNRGKKPAAGKKGKDQAKTGTDATPPPASTPPGSEPDQTPPAAEKIDADALT